MVKVKGPIGYGLGVVTIQPGVVFEVDELEAARIAKYGFEVVEEALLDEGADLEGGASSDTESDEEGKGETPVAGDDAREIPEPPRPVPGLPDATPKGRLTELKLAATATKKVPAKGKRGR